jgi:protein translocase SecG subunit
MKGLTVPVIIFGIISLLSAIALIVSVMFQTSKAESFSAAMGSGSETRFKPGSKEEWLYKITRVSAITWIVSLLIMSIFYYNAVE